MYYPKLVLALGVSLCILGCGNNDNNRAKRSEISPRLSAESFRALIDTPYLSDARRAKYVDYSSDLLQDDELAAWFTVSNPLEGAYTYYPVLVSPQEGGTISFTAVPGSADQYAMSFVDQADEPVFGAGESRTFVAFKPLENSDGQARVPVVIASEVLVVPDGAVEPTHKSLLIMDGYFLADIPEDLARFYSGPSAIIAGSYTEILLEKYDDNAQWSEGEVLQRLPEVYWYKEGAGDVCPQNPAVCTPSTILTHVYDGSYQLTGSFLYLDFVEAFTVTDSVLTIGMDIGFYQEAYLDVNAYGYFREILPVGIDVEGRFYADGTVKGFASAFGFSGSIEGVRLE